jgi:flagellar biosynthesis protein FlhB
MPHLSSGFSSVLNWTNSAMLNHLGLSTSNNLVVGLTWGCIGLVVYVLCMNMINFFKHLAGTYELKNYVSPTDAPKNQLLFQSLGKLFFQLLMTVVLVLYIIKLLAPVMLGHILPVPKQSVADLGADLIRIAVYILVLHGFVIILRLLMLRERLGEEEELPETHNL